MVANILVLLSGSGTNLQALIDACGRDPSSSSSQTSPSLPNCKVSHVISNRSSAFGLTRAATSNPPIPTTTVALKPYRTSHPDNPREAFDADLAKQILSLPPDQKPDIIVCAGWMHILSPAFLDPIAEADLPIINLHPAKPGAYDGAGAIERAYNDFKEGKIKGTGVMVHYVIKEVDRGDAIVVRDVEINETDSLEDLTNRIHAVEHVLLVEGTGTVIKKRIQEGKINISR